MPTDIYIRLRGGLGNQMFQYAYALSLANGFSANKILDVREYETYKVRNLEINDFVLDNNTRLHVEGKLNYDKKIKRFHIFQYLYQKIVGAPFKKLNYKLVKKGFIFGGRSSNAIAVNLPKEVFLYGYFQSVAPILSIRAQLVEYFNLTNVNGINYNKYSKIISVDSIAVSVRRGKDAMNSFSLPEKDYYIHALCALLSGDSERQIVVYCDCIDDVIKDKWFEQYKNVVYVRECTPCEQMQLMRISKDFIMSNSSFSWWGAFLGSFNKKSKVISPRIWYKNVPIAETELLYDEIMIL